MNEHNEVDKPASEEIPNESLQDHSTPALPNTHDKSLKTEVTLTDFITQVNKFNHVLSNPMLTEIRKNIIAGNSFLHDIAKTTIQPLHNHSMLQTWFKDLDIIRSNTVIKQAVMVENSLKNIGTVAAVMPLGNLMSLYPKQSIGRKFTLPFHTDIPALTKTFQHLIPAVAAVQGLQAAMAQMKHPWLDTENKISSMTAFVQLHNIGKRLDIWKPFGPTLTEYLRPFIGDWREKINIPHQTTDNPETRRIFYSKLGFNYNLTDFPEAALDETLTNAGIIPETLALTDVLGDPLTAPEQQDQHEGLNLTNKAHYHIIRFEIAIRKFIDERMTAEFGKDWPKSQLPNGLFDKWQEKKNKHKKAKPDCSDINIVEFADFPDYESIINRTDNWKRVFARFFQRQENVRETFQRLCPVRIEVMHSRLIGRDEFLLLFIELRRIHKACNLNWLQ